jgi:hypothetical protein
MVLIRKKAIRRDTTTDMRLLNYAVMSFSVALRGVFTTIESVFSALLVTIRSLDH